MRFSLTLNQLFVVTGLMAICSISYGSYGIPASTGSGLPYSVETKNMIKDLFDNNTIVGGQVIALKDQPGKNYSGNYIDIGSLSGVNIGDVFAFFTPQGEPVGFGRIVEVQRYTSSFSFIELTVDPTDNLIGKKVPEEIKIRLSSGKSIDLPMGRFKKGEALAFKKKHKDIIPTAQNEVLSNQSGLPPLPGDSTTPQTPNVSATLSNGGSTLPALPMDNTGAANINPSGVDVLPPLNASDNSLPGMDSNSNALQPLNNSSALPGMSPSDNNSQEIPPLSDNNPNGGNDGSSLPPITMGDGTTSSAPGMDSGSGLPPAASSTLPEMDNSGLPSASGTASLPGMTDTTVALAPGAGLPGMDSGSGLPPVASSTLPEMDNSGLPSASGTASLPGMTDTTVASAPGAGLPGMDSGSGLPPVASSTLPEMDNSGLPSASGTASLPGMTDTTVASAPGAGLPGMDSGSGLPPVASSTLPEMDNSGLPSASGTASLPGMTDTTVASAPGAGLPGMDSGSGLPPAASSTLPGMDNSGLPSASGTASLPGMTDTTVASAPGAGLPGMDSGSGLPPMVNTSLPIVLTDNSLPSGLPALEGSLPPVESTVPTGFPPTTMGSLPPTMDINAEQIAPPDVSATLPPMIANASSVPIQSSPTSGNYQPSDLDIPAVPSKVNQGYLQDIPTLSSNRKPAA